MGYSKMLLLCISFEQKSHTGKQTYRNLSLLHFQNHGDAHQRASFSRDIERHASTTKRTTKAGKRRQHRRRPVLQMKEATDCVLRKQRSFWLKASVVRQQADGNEVSQSNPVRGQAFLPPAFCIVKHSTDLKTQAKAPRAKRSRLGVILSKPLDRTSIR